MTDREDYALSIMWADPEWLNGFFESEGIPETILQILSGLLAFGLPECHDGNDCYAARLERNIELFRVAFVQWATRKPKWAMYSPLETKLRSMYDP